jgi:hypothetical protein
LCDYDGGVCEGDGGTWWVLFIFFVVIFLEEEGGGEKEGNGSGRQRTRNERNEKYRMRKERSGKGKQVKRKQKKKADEIIEIGNVGILTGPPFFTALAAYMNGTGNLMIQGVDYDASINGFLDGGDKKGAETM